MPLQLKSTNIQNLTVKNANHIAREQFYNGAAHHHHMQQQHLHDLQQQHQNQHMMLGSDKDQQCMDDFNNSMETEENW